MPQEEDLTPSATCECETCKRKGGKPNAVRPGTIHSYSSCPPAGWVARRTATERDRNPPVFGVELETDVAVAPRPDFTLHVTRPQSPAWDATEEEVAQFERRLEAYRVARVEYDRNMDLLRTIHAVQTITAEEAVSLAAPKGFWHAKYDSSVSGPEFVSQPASLAYWHAKRPVIATMFEALLHGGVRSHDYDHCGMHVNVNNRAFDDADHLYRFITLIVDNPTWSRRMSQRTISSQTAWARFDELVAPDRRRRVAQDTVNYGSGCTSHSCVLNMSHEGRIEFRLPRGTLRIDRFFAKLEWTAAMIEFTRDCGSVACTSRDFMLWAAEHGDDYPDLLAYIRERFPEMRVTRDAEDEE